MIRCAQDVHAECEKAGDLGEVAGSSQSCSPMHQEQDQTVVNFCDVLQGNMAVGLKSSEGKGLSSCVWRCGAGRRYVADSSWLLASASSPRSKVQPRVDADADCA